MKKIRPIPTKYKGIVFRSKLEARWAVYLDLMGFEWEYEEEGFSDGTNSYLPDFNVKGNFSSKHSDYGIEDFFVEVKPDISLSKKEIDKIKVVSGFKDVFVGFGAPSSKSGLLFTKDIDGIDVVLKSIYSHNDKGPFFYEKGHNPIYHDFEEKTAEKASEYDLIYSKEIRF